MRKEVESIAREVWNHVQGLEERKEASRLISSVDPGEHSDTKHSNFVAHLPGFQTRFEEENLTLNLTRGREDICTSGKI